MTTTPKGLLRYPNEIIYDTTDWLEIKIADYKKTRNSINKRKANASSGSTTWKVDKKTGQTYPTLDKGSVEVTGYTSYATRSERIYNKNIGESIILPIPSNIQDSNSVDWGDSSLDGLTASVLSAVQDVFTTAQNKPTVQEAITGGMTEAADRTRDILSNPQVAAHVNRVIAAQAARLPFGGNITASQLLARTEGKVINPNMELLFNGPTIRSFKFSFKMTPRDENESDNIKRIINTFKKNMVPQIDYGSDSDKSTFKSGLYLNAPKIFELSYMQGNGPHPFLHKFKPCALTNMTVNYTGDGVYSTYGEGTPVSMIMDLGFKELEPIYSADYENKKEAGTGVGF